MIPTLLLLAFSANEPDKELRFLDQDADDYRTPRAGEGFHTEIFGSQQTIKPKTRRSISAWSAGLSFAFDTPGVGKLPGMPFGSVYLWRHPNENLFFRGVLVGLYNQLLYAQSLDELGPVEGVLTFENMTVPVDRSELVDGRSIEEEELLWGHARIGMGLGVRFQVDDRNDNMFAAALLLEHGVMHFGRGSDTRADFVTPPHTYELRGRFRLRLDMFERNLLGLAHSGLAAGADAWIGHRPDWVGHPVWTKASYEKLSGHVAVAGGLPFLGERHRVLLSVHAGAGENLDRFSQFSVGGGPSGREYEANSRVVLPGAAIRELTSRYYAILLAEYRYELFFFTYLSVRSSAAYLDRQRSAGPEGDFLWSLGGRLTTGFLFKTRLQLDYNYNAEVIRDGERGGHELTFHISGKLWNHN